MKENLKEAIDFTNKIKGIKGILQIVLFGSVARGEDTLKSDIDIAIIHNHKDKFELMKEVNKHKTEKIQTTFISIDNLPKESELTGALSGEGLLLYGRPVIIKEKKLDLSAKILIAYSLADLPQTEKVKVNRALYGSVSKSSFQGKNYKTETKGLTNEPGIEKISKGVLLVKREKAPKIVNMLKRFKVKVREIPVWGY
mgnify:CR=1 FL=1